MTEHEFNESILPLAQHIYDFAANLTGNRTDAADITQDVLFKLWNSRNELSKIKNLRAWALKITRNLYYDTVKKYKPLYNEAQMFLHEQGASDLMTIIDNQETAALVRQIIETLPDTQREVILLREVEELEYDEIAQITGLGLNNIRTILSRARSRVKELLVKKYKISKYD